MTTDTSISSPPDGRPVGCLASHTSGDTTRCSHDRLVDERTHHSTSVPDDHLRPACRSADGADFGCVFGKFKCRSRIIGPKTPCIRNYNNIVMKSFQGHATTHTCTTTKCMHRRLARRTRTQSTAKAQSGRNRARPLCTRAPNPGSTAPTRSPEGSLRSCPAAANRLAALRCRRVVDLYFLLKLM